MALEVNISVSQNSSCKSFAVYDITGPYNSISNPTGYGGTNLDLTDLDSAQLIVTPPGSSTTYTIDLAVPITTIPSESSDVRHIISNTDVGLSSADSLSDGLWTVEYLVNITDSSSPSGTTQVTATATCFFYCTVKCCVDKLVAAVDFESCCTEPFDMMTTIRAYIALRSLKLAVACNKVNKANAILARLQKLCLTSSCNC